MGVALLGIGKSGEGPGLSGVRDDRSPVGHQQCPGGRWK